MIGYVGSGADARADQEKPMYTAAVNTAAKMLKKRTL